MAARPVASDPEPQDLTADGPEELPSASSSGAVAKEDVVKAIRCATGINDAVVLHALATTLPPSILQEQVALIDADGKRKARLAGQPQLVDPRLLVDCTRVFHEFAQYLRDNGCPQTTTRRQQMPRGLYKRFLQERVAFKGLPLKNPATWLRKGYWAWRQKGHVAPNYSATRLQRWRRSPTRLPRWRQSLGKQTWLGSMGTTERQRPSGKATQRAQGPRRALSVVRAPAICH